MKKTYIQPSTLIVKIESSQVIANSQFGDIIPNGIADDSEVLIKENLDFNVWEDGLDQPPL